MSEIIAGETEVAIAEIFPLAEGATAYASRGAARAPGKTVLRVREC